MELTPRMAILVFLSALLVGESAGYGQSAPLGAQPLKPMAADANPGLEVTTIKPSDPSDMGKTIDLRGHNFAATNVTVNDLLVLAYGVQVSQIAGGPGWFEKAKFNIVAIPDAEGKPSRKQFDSIVMKLLAERFGLTLHHETRELPAFVLTVAKGGAKLTANVDGKDGLERLNIQFGKGGVVMLSARNESMAGLCSALQQNIVERPVVDKTGLVGLFDIKTMFAIEGTKFASMPMPMGLPSDDAAVPNLFTAIQDLGLKLDPVKTAVDVLVVDRAAKPSEN